MKAKEKVLKVMPMLEATMEVTLVGTSLLCCNNFSQKTILMLSQKQQGLGGKTGKAARNPKSDWEAAFYLDSSGKPAIPARNLKSALVYSAHNDKGISKVNVRGGVFVAGQTEKDWLTINGTVIPFDIDAPDPVRNSGPGNVADLRWRPKWNDWSVTAHITFDPNKVSESQLLTLLFEAGRISGLLEGRPEKSSLSWGMFTPDLESLKLSEPRDVMGDVVKACEAAKKRIIKSA